MFKQSVSTVSFIALSLVLSACGQERNILKGADVQTSTVGSNTYVGLDAILDLGSLKLPSMDINVNHPKTGQHIGNVVLTALEDGTSKVGINIDFTSVSSVDPALGSSLPNGRELPAGLGAQNATLIGIPILENSRVYVGGEISSDLFIGVALGIPALDSVVSQSPISLNLFLPIQFSTQVMGLGGLYTSQAKGQNGFGIFVKRSAPTPVNAKMMSANPPPLVVSEYERLNQITKYKLNRLMHKRATLRVK